MPYGLAHTETIPTVSTTVGPDYASQVNACIEEIRATIDAKVTPAGLDMNATLSFLSGGTNYPITNLERANFQNKSGTIDAALYPNALYVVNGDLYYNDNSGNEVRIINAGALNIAATGGITGSGYGSGSVEVNWSTADAAYKLKSGASSYASAWMNDLYLNDGDTNFVRITAQAMAADYALTLPAALPGSTSLLTLTSGGSVLSSRDPSVDTVTTTGVGTFGGLVTASAGLTAAANQHVTISGTGRFKHGTMTLAIPASAMHSGTIADWSNTDRAWAGWTSDVYCPIMLPAGARLLSVDVFTNWLNDTNQTISLSYVDTSGTNNVVAGPQVIDATTAAVQTWNFTDHTLVAGRQYYFQIDGNADTGGFLYGVEVSYDYP